MILPDLNIQQWFAIVSYTALLITCIAWILRFGNYKLYAVPPMTVAVHGLLFYSLYFFHGIVGAGNALQIAWSPFLRIHGSLVYILLIMLMWEKLALRERAEKVAEALFEKRINGNG